MSSARSVSHSGHRGRRLRGEARSRRPEGLRAARRPADGRVVDRGLRGGGRRRDRRRRPARARARGPRRGAASASSPAARPAPQSVANALEAVETDLVAVHDAARPLITPALVDGVVAALAADPGAAGAIAAAPVTDTIKRPAPPERSGPAPSRARRTWVVAGTSTGDRCCGRRRRRRYSGPRPRAALGRRRREPRRRHRRGDAGRGGRGAAC